MKKKLQGNKVTKTIRGKRKQKSKCKNNQAVIWSGLVNKHPIITEIEIMAHPK